MYNLERGKFFTKYSDKTAISSQDSGEQIMRSVINYLKGYLEKKDYVGDFDLEDTIKVPRPCADSSAKFNITDPIPDYYIGQTERVISGDELGMTSAVADMSQNNVWMFENGTIATNQIGYFDANTDAWYIKTEDSSYIGKLRTIVRGCSSSNRLTDLFFRTEIKKNTKPDFMSPF